MVNMLKCFTIHHDFSEPPSTYRGKRCKRLCLFSEALTSYRRKLCKELLYHRQLVVVVANNTVDIAGVCKLGRTCCAFIAATVDNCTSAVTAEYCQHHVGHTMDTKHLRLSAELRMEIAGLLQQGVTVSKVRDNIRDRASGDIQRDHLLSRYVPCYYNLYALYYPTLDYKERIWAQAAYTNMNGHNILNAHVSHRVMVHATCTPHWVAAHMLCRVVPC